MTNLWIGIISAGGVIVGVLIAGGTAWLQDAHSARRDRQTDLARRRAAAYSKMITQSVLVVFRARGLQLTMKYRSGLSESLDFALWKRRPLEPMQVLDWQMQDLAPLIEALAEISVVGTKEANEVANLIVDKCRAVLDAATARGKARSPLMRAIVGEKWTRQQDEALECEERDLAKLRRQLAQVARSEIGVDFAQVFRLPESVDSQ